MAFRGGQRKIIEPYNFSLFLGGIAREKDG